jgi:inorganic pyrophosphatase
LADVFAGNRQTRINHSQGNESMSLNAVPPGPKSPDEVNVIIEIPAHSDPVKYEVDKDTGAVFVDRFMSTAMFYPCNYGYIPGTLSDDGDPVDVLVHTPHNVISGTVISCRPIGVLKMSDEAGEDAKLLAVPTSKLSSLYDDVHQAEDLPALLLKQIQHFFEHYKDLEVGKWVKIEGWADADAAKEEIRQSTVNYEKNL